MSSRLSSSGAELTQFDFGRVAFELGADHARFNLRRPRAKDVPQDFLRGFDSYNGRKKGTKSWAVKKWLALRLSALKRNLILSDNVTPKFLSEIRVARCPVTLIPLTSGEGTETDISIDRIISHGAYAEGNLVAMSVRANEAKGELTFFEVRDIAERGKGHGKLSAQEWARMTSLMFGTQVDIDKSLDGICPLCTALPPRTFFALTQIFQRDILFEALNQTSATMPSLRKITYEALGSTALYEQLYQTLNDELSKTDYPYDAWYSLRAFEMYLEWIDGMNSYLADATRSMMNELAPRIDEYAQLPKIWSLPTNGRFLLNTSSQGSTN